MNEFTFDEIEVGYSQSFTKEITEEMEDAFRNLSGDENPLHKSDEFAGEISDGRFKKHVSFGMLTASLYSTLAGMYIPGKYSLIHSFDELAFMKPVFAGDVLTVTGTVMEKEEALKLIRVRAEIKNQSNKSVSRAKIKVLVLK